MPTVTYVAEGMGLIGNRYENALVMSHKYKMRQVFFKNGVNQPRFTIAKKEQYPDMTGFQFPLIIKPTDRCSSVGVKKVDHEAELKEAIHRAQQLAYSQEAIIEEYVSGCEATVDMITWQGIHYPITISDTETTGAPYFSKIGYHQPSHLNADIQTKIIVAAKKALTALKFEFGASDIEVKVSETGEVKIIEINPRMGGDFTECLVELSTGYDIIKGVIDIALGQFKEPSFPLKKCSGICFCREDTYYIKQAIKNKKKYPDIVKAVFFEKKERYLDRLGYLIYQSGQRRDLRRILDIKIATKQLNLRKKELKKDGI